MNSLTLKYFDENDFSRDDQRADPIFYSNPRLVGHLDSLALTTVENVFAGLIPKESDILDLMAGPDSHLRDELVPKSVTGLGLNKVELEANSKLSAIVIHDLNENYNLPFDKNTFDVTINCVSVDYLIRPVDIFSEVGRVLRPDGIFILVFSNRMFPPKAVNIWKNTPEKDRVDLVKKFISLSGALVVQGYSESKGKPRPKDDKYFKYGIPSDPIYTVWATVKK